MQWFLSVYQLSRGRRRFVPLSLPLHLLEEPEVGMPPLEVLHPLVHAPVGLVGKRRGRDVLVLLVPRRRVCHRVGREGHGTGRFEKFFF